MAALREDVAVKRVTPLVRTKLLEGKAGSLESDAEAGEGTESVAASEPVAGVMDVKGFTMDAVGMTPVGSDQVIPWGEVHSCRSEEQTRDTVRLTATTHFVVMETEETTFRVAMSNRDAFVVLCTAMTIRESGQTG